MSSWGMSGLGIDFGSEGAPPPPPSARRPTSSSIGGFASDSSASVYSSHRLSTGPNMGRRPTTAEDRARRVRIASGEPGVLGHGAGSTDDDSSYAGSPDSMASSALSSTVSSADGYTRSKVGSGPLDSLSRPANLHRLIRQAASGSTSDSSWAGASTPSEYMASSGSEKSSSPRTQVSAAPSSASSGISRKSAIIRKQASQPNLGVRPTVVMRGPPQAGRSAMVRSKSSMALASDFNSGTSLGRSAEIRGPRSNAGSERSAPVIKLRSLSQTMSVAPTDDGSDAPEPGMIPDGFGGFISSDEGSSAASGSRAPSSVGRSSPSVSEASSVPTRAGATTFDGPAMAALPPSQHATASHARSQSVSSSVTAPPPAARLRVGSFYGTDGIETARLDARGRLSMAGSSQSSSDRRQSRAESELTGTAPTARSRSQSQSGPRAQMMASPAGAMARSETVGAQPSQSQASQSSTAAPPANPTAPAGAATARPSVVAMRSSRGWSGLEGAENGGTMITLDQLTGGFQGGELIVPDRMRRADEQSTIGGSSPEHTVARRPGSRASTHDVVGPSDSISNVGARSSFSGGPQHAARKRSLSAAAAPEAALLERNGTLLSSTSNPARRSRDLSRLLAGSSGRLGSSAASSAGDSVSSRATDTSARSGSSAASRVSLARSNATTAATSAPPAILEQGRSSKARVDVDIVLESDLVVEGGMLRGRLELKVRKPSSKSAELMLAQPKIRVVGFEELLNDDTRHIFYHHACVIDGDRSMGGPSEPYVLHGSPDLCSPVAEGREPLPCFASAPDGEGYCLGKEGMHSIPFSLELPVGKGAKGSYRGKNALVRYIVIGSVKLKNADGSNRSIAHFYRHVELYPYLNPAVILASASRQISATASKGLFLGGPGKVHLTASLHRAAWVAGQRVYVNIGVDNETTKKIKSLTMALVRVVTLYRPRPELDLGMSAPDDPTDSYIDPDACTTATSRKKIAEETLEMGQKGSKGIVTAKGWWTGVEAGGSVNFSHYMRLPTETLSITRGRHVEVQYFVKISVGSSLSADVSVELPVRIVNFVSLDPPPIKTKASRKGAAANGATSKSWSQVSASHAGGSSSEAPMIERVRSMEALRSPARLDPPTVAPGGRLGVPGMMAARRGVPGMDAADPATAAKRLQHQKSLDFIQHAIRSATARRGLPIPSADGSPQGLGIEVPDDIDAASLSGMSTSTTGGPVNPSCLPYQHPSQPQRGQPPFLHVNSISLDDFEGDSDDEDLVPSNPPPVLNDDSIAEVDSVLGSAQLDAEDLPSFGRYDRESSVDSDASSVLAPNADDLSLVDEEAEEYAEYDAARREQSAWVEPGNVSRHDVSMDDVDDAPTPLAKSPPKMASLVRHGDSLSSRRNSSQASSPAKLSAKVSPSSLPRTEMMRPVSPSKSAPSPTKSALKNKSSFSFATADSPIKACKAPGAVAGPATVAATAGEVRQLRAKVSIPALAAGEVSRRELPKASPERRAQRPLPVPVEKPAAPAPQQAEDHDLPELSDEGTPTQAQSSPSTVASVRTPESLADEFEQRVTIEASSESQREQHPPLAPATPAKEAPMTPLRISSKPSTPIRAPLTATTTTPTSSTPTATTPSATPEAGGNGLRRTTSTHTLRGAAVVIPSVRDKILMLESRKQALRDFTRASSASPSVSVSSTASPGRMAGFKTASSSSSMANLSSPSRTGPTTPSGGLRAKTSLTTLRRQESFTSSTSDESEAASSVSYAPSLASFRAPMFKSSS